MTAIVVPHAATGQPDPSGNSSLAPTSVQPLSGATLWGMGSLMFSYFRFKGSNFRVEGIRVFDVRCMPCTFDYA